MNNSAKFKLYHPCGFDEFIFFLILFRKFSISVAMVPTKLKGLDKNGMFGWELIGEHFCKLLSKYLQWDSNIANFHFSHCKSMATLSCHSNQSSFPIGAKNINIRPPPISTNRCYIWNMVRICITASEEMLFENVRRRRTNDGWMAILWALM